MNIYDYVNGDEIRQHAIDRLKEYIGEGIQAEEVHYHLFNEDYYIIGTYQAKQWMGEYAFDCIGLIQEYEDDHFGERIIDCGNPEKVVNMYAYIVGELILNESETLSEFRGNILADEDIKMIIEELEEL